jgi:hypothetical protein
MSSLSLIEADNGLWVCASARRRAAGLAWCERTWLRRRLNTDL